jgi:shikimate 5-dehydrogenase
MFAGIIRLALLGAGGLSNAVIWAVEKVLTEEFFKAVVAKTVEVVGTRLAKRTSNKIDDLAVAKAVELLKGK